MVRASFAESYPQIVSPLVSLTEPLRPGSPSSSCFGSCTTGGFGLPSPAKVRTVGASSIHDAVRHELAMPYRICLASNPDSMFVRSGFKSVQFELNRPVIGPFHTWAAEPVATPYIKLHVCLVSADRSCFCRFHHARAAQVLLLFVLHEQAQKVNNDFWNQMFRD